MPLSVVFDHIARPDIVKEIDHPDFLRFVEALQNDKYWTKVSCPERLTQQSSNHENYSDLVSFMKCLVDAVAKLYSNRTEDARQRLNHAYCGPLMALSFNCPD